MVYPSEVWGYLYVDTLVSVKIPKPIPICFIQRTAVAMRAFRPSKMFKVAIESEVGVWPELVAVIGGERVAAIANSNAPPKVPPLQS